jgi:hypothetical protein
MGSRMLSLMMTTTLAVAANAALIGISASRSDAQEPTERSRTQGRRRATSTSTDEARRSRTSRILNSRIAPSSASTTARSSLAECFRP